MEGGTQKQTKSHSQFYVYFESRRTTYFQPMTLSNPSFFLLYTSTNDSNLWINGIFPDYDLPLKGSNHLLSKSETGREGTPNRQIQYEDSLWKFPMTTDILFPGSWESTEDSVERWTRVGSTEEIKERERKCYPITNSSTQVWGQPSEWVTHWNTLNEWERHGTKGVDILLPFYHDSSNSTTLLI